MEWQLAEAKNKFSELVNRALTEGPQRVRRRERAVIVLSEEDYQKLKGQRPSFLAQLFDGPSFEGMDLTRDGSSMREENL